MIRKGRDVAHVDATTYNDSPRREHLRACTTRSPTGAKIMAASSFSGGSSSEPPAKAAPRPRANSSCQVTGARKSKDLNLFVQSDLGYDMRCRPETIDTEILTRFQIGKLERTPAYQAGTKKRRQLNIRITFRRFENIVLIGDSIFGKATIYGITGE